MTKNYTEFIVRMYPPKGFEKTNYYRTKWLRNLLQSNIYVRKITVKKVKKELFPILNKRLPKQ